MCTLTFMPARGGFTLAMNRDEQRSRPAALGPARVTAGDLSAWHPREPGGGTWIGINERGLALALLNGHQRPPRAGRPSRGLIIPRVLGAHDPGELDRLLGSLDLDRTNPFRLVAVDPQAGELREYVWDGARIGRARTPWQLRHWFSSSFDESRVVASRAAVARAAAADADAGTAVWARRLHASHEPRRGPYSICLHRNDATTVSYTEVTWLDSEARVDYLPGPPCSGGGGG